MDNPQPSPDQVLIQTLIVGKFATRALTDLANLGIADQLAGGALTASQLAAKTDSNEDALYRTLRALAAIGIFKELPERKFANNDVSELLRGDVPASMRSMVQWINAPCAWQAWGRFGHSLATGKPAFDEVHGKDAFGFFKDHPEEGKIFHDAMTGFSGMTAQAVVEAYDFSGFEKLVDVGGGHGMLVKTIVEKNAGLRGVLFDLPEVVKDAGKVIGNLSGRISTEAGSFLEGVPAGGDAYIMKHIIHDWDDDSCVKILGHCREVMAKDAKVLIVDMLLTEGPEGNFPKFLDLEMLAMTHGGRERSEADFAKLFERSGLQLSRVVRTESPVVVVEGVSA